VEAGICGLRLGERLCAFAVEEATVAAERLPKTRRTRFCGGVLAGVAMCLQSGVCVMPAFPVRSVDVLLKRSITRL